MNLNNQIRQFHRWLAIAFTAGFLVNLVVAIRGIEPAFWVYLLALVPLFLLLPTGLYMFFLPHVAAWRAGRNAMGRN